MYLKNASVIEVLPKITTVVFDKTGTLTYNQKNNIDYKGDVLTTNQKMYVKTVLRASNHPLSRMLYNYLEDADVSELNAFEEIVGKGLKAEVNGQNIKLGSSSFVEAKAAQKEETAVYVSINDVVKGKFVFRNSYRDGVVKMFEVLSQHKNLVILSGDNEGEKQYLIQIIPSKPHLPIRSIVNKVQKLFL